MKRNTVFIVLTLILSCLLSSCNSPVSSRYSPPIDNTCKNHSWLYDGENGQKVCSICEISEDYSPSGYYLNPIQIEVDSAKPYFNDEHILCAYSERTYKEFNLSKEKALVEKLFQDGEIFYVDVDTTCDILPDTNMLAPQRHIVITSGDYNGVECWTAMAVVVDDFDVNLYMEWLDSPRNSQNQTDSNIDRTSSNSEFQNEDSDYVGIFDGTYLVGSDIPPGTYRLVPLSPDYKGYWVRCSDASGNKKSVLANDLFDSATYVTVYSGDYFIIKRCSGALQQ